VDQVIDRGRPQKPYRATAAAADARAVLAVVALAKTYRMGEVDVAALAGVDLSFAAGEPDASSLASQRSRG
jgi:hypothetical protein